MILSTIRHHQVNEILRMVRNLATVNRVIPSNARVVQTVSCNVQQQHAIDEENCRVVSRSATVFSRVMDKRTNNYYASSC